METVALNPLVQGVTHTHTPGQTILTQGRSAGETMSSILELSVEELAAALAKGQISALEVLKTYQARAELIHHACNAVAFWIPDAEARAREADEHLQRTGKVLGPLHGVPFTVKDHVMVQGTPITMGMQSLKKTGKKSGRDEYLVKAFRALGAIPFAKSTMSQLGMTIGGGSPAHGDTLNPWDTLRSPGGSSCGEGALVGGGATPFGIGSDVGGSVRVPAAFCGISALKPTVGRISTMLTRPGEYFVPATTGVMAKSAKDLSLVYSLLLSQGLTVGLPRIPPLPFDASEFSSSRKLRIGCYLEEYTFPKPCKAVCRAVEESTNALKALGHEIVDFKPHSSGVLPREMVWDLDASFYISAEPYNPSKQNRKQKSKEDIRSQVMPSWTDSDEETHPDLIGMFRPKEAYDSKDIHHGGSMAGSSLGYEQLYGKRDAMRERFYNAWQAAGLDALLCPVSATPALHVEEVQNAVSNVVTTRVFNLLDMPAGVVTVSLVKDSDLVPYDPGTQDPDVTRMAKRAVQDSLGLPVGVQVVTLPWREELCLRTMLELEKGFGFSAAHYKLAPLARRSRSLGAPPEAVSRL
ncbi:unnamed protein product [Durusdinium trenchii]|uniref:Amidase domain-containing protein n=1 Tax=Durusdinium trenchii TaxID=1381693 RepID=A0ABP0RJA9_9DINO